MTWQSIDENTYIDDSLIFCSEYQLFIYQARARDVFFHLDHWQTHEFPKGKAREPVLGVRFQDARSFCSWLSYQNDMSWKFRLPFSTEAENHPLPSYWGYWTMSEVQAPLFAWGSDAPSDARKIDAGKLHNHVIAKNPSFNHSSPQVVAQAYNKLQRQPVDIEITKSKIKYQPIKDEIEKYVSSVRIPTLSDKLSVLNKLILGASENDLDAFIDLFTLQERIAGRSPAFEGIRLVKERTR